MCVCVRMRACVCVHACMLSRFNCAQLFATLWTVACQTPLSMGFSRQEYWSGLSCLPPGDLPDPGIEPMSPARQAASLPLSHGVSPLIPVIPILPIGKLNGPNEHSTRTYKQ